MQAVKARVSLLMATRNQAGYAYHAVASLLNQVHDNFTLTIVNDASTDNTLGELKAFKDSRITIINQSRPQGFIPSLNLAMQKSRPSAFCGVVYGSCYYASTYLTVLVNFLIRNSKASGSFCHFCEGDLTHLGAKYLEPCFDANELLVRDQLGPGVIFRHSAFQAAGGLFLSEKKGLLETWQRMSQKSGPFIQNQQILLRWRPHAYDTPPVRPRPDPEKEIYPFLKVQAQALPDDPIDPEWLLLMQEAGHRLVRSAEVKERPQLVLCSSLDYLEKAQEMARNHYAPLLLLVNNLEMLQELQEPQWAYALGAAKIATSALEVARALKALNIQPVVYMSGMTKREVTRLLSRIPMILHRHQSVLLIRSYGGPQLIQQTLNGLQKMNRPPEFGSLFVYCAERNARTIQWLKERGISFEVARQYQYYPELLFMLKQLSGSFVLGLDAGVIPGNNWFYELWPLLADARVGMASGFMNGGSGEQRLPFKPAQLVSLDSLMQAWGQYQTRRPIERVKRLSDSAFLMRKSVLERVLASQPEAHPLSDDLGISKQLRRLGYINLLKRTTMAINTLEML